MVDLFLILFSAVCPVFGTIEQQEQAAPTFAKWEVEIAALEELQKCGSTREGVVFYGSSSIRLWETIARDMAPWPVVKRGFGGAKLPDVIHFAPRILGPHLGVHNPNRCRAVVLFVANDISGNVNEGATPDVVRQRFSTLLTWIRQQDATVPVFWIEVTPTEFRWDLWPKIQLATNQICRSIDEQAATWFVPTADSFLNSAGRPNSSLFQPDQLHLNPEGYQVWSSLIKSHLEQHLAVNSGIRQVPVQEVELSHSPASKAADPNASLAAMIRPMSRGDRLHVFTVNPRRRPEEAIAMQTLQGVAARVVGPRIWLDVGDNHFIDYLKTEFDIQFDLALADDFSGLLGKLRDATSGQYILYDFTDKPSISAATTMAGVFDAIAIDVDLEGVATEMGYTLALDVRGKDCRWVYENYRSQLSQDGLVVHTNDRRRHPSAEFLRDWGPATKSLDWWYNDGQYSDRVYRSMRPASPVYGWQDPTTSDEGITIEKHSAAGLYQIPSDWMLNLSVHAATGGLYEKRKFAKERNTLKAVSQVNTHTVTFVMSDMDNILTEIGTRSFHSSKRYFSNRHTGKFPMTWGMAPSLVDLSPAGVDMWYRSAPANDAFIAYCGRVIFSPVLHRI